MNELLTYAIVLALLIVAYVQFVMMLIELEAVLSVQKTLNANNRKRDCLCSRTTTDL